MARPESAADCIILQRVVPSAALCPFNRKGVWFTLLLLILLQKLSINSNPIIIATYRRPSGLVGNRNLHTLASSAEVVSSILVKQGFYCGIRNGKRQYVSKKYSTVG